MKTNTQLYATDTPSLDAAYELLRDERRRRVVRALAERDARVSLRELAANVAARARGTDPNEVPRETVDRVALGLHHVHLPKFADADVVAYDPERNTVLPVRPGPLVSLLERIDADGQ